MAFENEFVLVPQELRELRQWMNWRNENGTKVPYQPNGQVAKTNDPKTWSTWDDVAVDGKPVAWVFDAEDPYCGVDLDDCYVDGECAPWAEEIINRFKGVAWIEISPSGNGVKLITRAKKSDGARCSFNKDGVKVECYDNR